MDCEDRGGGGREGGDGGVDGGGGVCEVYGGVSGRGVCEYEDKTRAYHGAAEGESGRVSPSSDFRLGGFLDERS